MKKIILCEGKTDAIILSYFLDKQYNWEHKKLSKNQAKTFPKFNLEDNESLNWYEKNDDKLAIYSCGGISNIPNNLKKISELNSSQDNNKKFDKIVIMIDHDEETIDTLQKMIINWLKDSKIIMEAGFKLETWLNARIKSQKENSEEYLDIELLFIVIPKDRNGNLELFLLDALKENKEDELIVNESKNYIDKVSGVSYLEKDRYKVKAQLQSVLSVISPEWVFSQIDKRLKRVNWSNLEEISSAYKELDKL